LRSAISARRTSGYIDSPANALQGPPYLRQRPVVAVQDLVDTMGLGRRRILPARHELYLQDHRNTFTWFCIVAGRDRPDFSPAATITALARAVGDLAERLGQTENRSSLRHRSKSHPFRTRNPAAI